MIRKSNSDVRLQADKKSKDSNKTPAAHKESEVSFYFNCYSFLSVIDISSNIVA